MKVCAQLRQGGIRLPCQQSEQAFFARFREEGFAPAAVGLRIQRAPGFEVLAHPPHGGHAVAEAGGDGTGALALVIKLEDPFTHRNRDGFHVLTLPQPLSIGKLHYLCKRSKAAKIRAFVTCAEGALGHAAHNVKTQSQLASDPAH